MKIEQFNILISIKLNVIYWNLYDNWIWRLRSDSVVWPASTTI